MRLLTNISRLIGRARQQNESRPAYVYVPVQRPDSAELQENDTRPTQCVKDHHLLKLHKVIDLSG